MIAALGYSHNSFNAGKPGRLCRGRERWIEPWELEEDAMLHRLVISGAAFTDDSARDALRGINHSRVKVAQVVQALYPDRRLLVFMEDGHPADIPDGAEDLEVYVGYRAGGQQSEPMVRWTKEVCGAEAVEEILGSNEESIVVRGFAVLHPDQNAEELKESVFQLTGMSCVDSPPACFQPAVLPEILALVESLILIHRDKHGPSVGVYSKEPVETDGRLDSVCDASGSLLVPFAIPPMLARWDRALAEMRAAWEQEQEAPFPVPASSEPSHWDSRGRRRHRRRGKGNKKDSSSSDATEQAEDTREEQSAEPMDEQVVLVVEPESEPKEGASASEANTESSDEERDLSEHVDDALLVEENDALLVEENDALVVKENDALVVEENDALVVEEN